MAAAWLIYGIRAPAQGGGVSETPSGTGPLGSPRPGEAQRCLNQALSKSPPLVVPVRDG